MNFLLLAQAANDKPTEDPAPAVAETDPLLEQAFDKLKNLELTNLTGEEWLSILFYYSIPVITVLVTMIAAWIVSGIISSMIRRGLSRVNFDQTLTKFFAKLARWLILLLAALTCISAFGVDTTSFAAVIGAAGLAVGLAFQGTLSNFASGGMLLVFRPFKVGDAVNVAGITGLVNEIAVFTTEIDTFDGRRIIIPNSEIYGSVIENITYHPRRRIDVPVGAAYDADIDRTREVLERAIAAVEGVESDPEPAVVLDGLGGSSVDWIVRAWAKKEDFLGVKQALIRSVKVELDAAGIGIPYPQMDVHLDQPVNVG